MPRAISLAAAERADLLRFLRTLSPQQWEAPTLCTGWRVRDVVAHIVSYEELGTVGLVRRFCEGRLRLSRINDAGVKDFSGASPAALLDLLERHLWPRGLSTSFGGRIALVDGLIHHQDIRRPLGAPRAVPQERLREALPFALLAPPIRGLWHVRGVRLVATDLDWTAGRGPEARGPAEAILMAIAGRRNVARDLTGPGADRLVDRLG